MVAGSEPGAAKLARAGELGIPVIDEATFAVLLETGALPRSEAPAEGPGVDEGGPPSDGAAPSGSP